MPCIVLAVSAKHLNALVFFVQSGVESEESEQDAIHIVIKANTTGKFAGKFGFNVKGGADQEAPVLVSKVTAGSPADTCCPRLNEGDQVSASSPSVVSV